MNSNHQQTSPHHQQIPIYPQLLTLYQEGEGSSSASKTGHNFYTKDTFIAPSNRHRHQSTFKHDLPHIASPTEKNNSFSDIISPQNVNTVINMSLEKELENNNQKSLNTISNRSNMFDESSIHKDQNNKQGNPSAFDMKEHDSLLDGNLGHEAILQPNKRICILCHNSNDVQNAIIAGKQDQNLEDIWEYDLIYPCLCNIKAHRECLKSYILMKKVTACERCKTTYAIGGKKSIEKASSKEGFFAEIIAVFTFIITWICSLWRKYVSHSLIDIVIHCKQTEIARHQDNPEQIFRRFMDKEEDKRSSTVLNRARKIFGSMDTTEFETFIKMTTPRIDRPDKVASHERQASSHFLLSDPSKPKDDDESSMKQIKKEIFIAPTEVEKSEATMPDHPSNINEYSKIRNSALPQVKITSSNPSKHIDPVPLKPELRPFRPQIRVTGIVGSQSERQYGDLGMKPQASRLFKLPLKDQQSISGIGNRIGYSARDQVHSPDFINHEPSK